MNSSPENFHGRCSARRSDAFALVLVLIALALITAITVFFISNVGRERRGIDQYSRSSEVRLLSDTAVNLVIGQINAATKEGVASSPISWASQPGMIRTYKPDGTMSYAYKLYSWDNLKEGGDTFDPVNDMGQYPSASWNTLPAQYTDLNAPINGVYPIADPTIANNASTPATATPLIAGSAVPTWDFPTEFSVATGAKGYAASSNKLPMPVKWMYVLQDGSLVSPTASITSTVEVTVNNATPTNPIVGRVAFWTDDETSKVNINTASEGAFWDTPKAATQDEMQFAGNPPARNEFQRVSGHPATTSLSAIFPELRAKGGFSRWTSSNSVNSDYLADMRNLFNLSPRIDWTNTTNQPKTSTTPWGGSQAGTFPVDYNQTYAPPTSTVVKTDSVALDLDRLYASADDLWFQAPQASTATTGRSANTAFFDGANNVTNLTPPQMARRLFLFTASSRAPETTLFETPRISLWPVTWPYDKTTYYKNGTLRTTPPPVFLAPDATKLDANPWMTYQERLLAFCATLQGKPVTPGSANPLPYYFQRQNPDSPTYDWDNIERNRDLTRYLRNEMSQQFPGMGFSLSDAAKWGSANSDWIALNCFDFSRSLVNQYTYNQINSGSGGYTSGSDYLYTYTGVQVSSGVLNGGTASAHSEPNAFTVVPLHIPIIANGVTYTTEGAFPALKEASLVFYATQREIPVAPIAPPTGVTPLTDPADPRNWKHLITCNTGNAATDQSQTKEMQAVMLLSFSGINPGVFSLRGNTYFSPVFWIKISRTSDGPFKVNGKDINFPTGAASGNVVQYSAYHPFAQYMSAVEASLFLPVKVIAPPLPAGTPKTFDNGFNDWKNWSLISDKIGGDSFGITFDKTTFSFTGSKIQVDIYAPDPSGDITKDPTGNSAQLVSSQTIDFSAWSRTLPIPIAPRWNVKQTAAVPMPKWGFAPSDNSSMAAVTGWQTELVPVIGLLNSMSSQGMDTDPRVTSGSYTVPTAGTAATGAEALIYAYKDNNGTLMSPDFQVRAKALRAPGFSTAVVNAAEGGGIDLFNNYSQPQYIVQGYQLVTPYDTAISMVRDPSKGAAGDPRLMGRGDPFAAGGDPTQFVAIDLAMASIFGAAAPKPLQVVTSTGMFARSTERWQHHTLSTAPGMRFPTGYWADYLFAEGSATAPTYTEMGIRGLYTASGTLLLGRTAGDAVVGVDTNVSNLIQATWDWTSLPGNFADGGYINRPDQDYQVLTAGGYNGLRVPYFNDAGLATNVGSGNQALSVFVPNRQIPSPVVLGTLPSSMTKGWQTLNFCPNPASAMNVAGGSHPGLGKKNPPTATQAPYTSYAPDHLLLDLLWMPVAEPYPISDQMSTAGKVNLNYAMMPFPYIQRKTALDAVLKSVWLAALPSPKSLPNFSKYYKSYAFLYNTTRLDMTRTRFPVNVDATLKAFDYKFDQGDIFRSASQICDMFLYPNSPTATNQLPTSSLVTDASGSSANITNWWSTKSLTADNVREDPYSAIYSRVTTKSNTFTVHWKVQTLQKRPNSTATTWTENQDTVTSESRGSTLIERYIDPGATLPDYAKDTSSTALPLSHYYKWRTVSENYFQP